MNITSVRVNHYTNGKLRGFADITFDSQLQVKGWKIWDGKNGLFVGNPSAKNKDGEYKDTIWIDDKELKEAIQDAVLTEYHSTSTSGEQSGHRRNVRATLRGPGDLPDPPF